MNQDYFHQLARKTPTRMWVNNPSLDDAQAAIDAGAWACTTNPTYASKVLAWAPEFGTRVVAEAAAETEDDQLAADLIQRRCLARILPVFESLYTGGPDGRGLVSVQGNPHRDRDAAAIVDEAMAYRKLGPNVIAKIPATQAGLNALEQVLLAGMPAIATEVMSLSQVRACVEVEQRVREQSETCPCYCITHITGIYDEYLAATVGDETVPQSLLADAGWMVARRQRALMDEMGSTAIMLGGGARSLRHFTDMVGARMHITINWSTGEELMATQDSVVERFQKPIVEEDARELAALVPDFRKAWEADGLAVEEFEEFGPVEYFRDMFVAGWDKLVRAVNEARSTEQ
jgi:transaldolase